MNGTQAPPVTTFYGLYDRAQSFGMQAAVQPAERLLERQRRLNLSTPLNFVSDCDIIGGNSGSPVINRDGELVGPDLRRQHRVAGRQLRLQPQRARAVAVHSAGMIEALRKLYDAGVLADELEARVATPAR